MEDRSNLSPIDLLNCFRVARVNLGSDVPREESRTLAEIFQNVDENWVGEIWEIGGNIYFMIFVNYEKIMLEWLFKDKIGWRELIINFFVITKHKKIFFIFLRETIID